MNKTMNTNRKSEKEIVVLASIMTSLVKSSTAKNNKLNNNAIQPVIRIMSF
jgi:hypothetical protein